MNDTKKTWIERIAFFTNSTYPAWKEKIANIKPLRFLIVFLEVIKKSILYPLGLLASFLFKGHHFSLSVAGIVIIPLMAFIIGFMNYQSTMTSLQDDVYAAYLESNVICEILEGNSMIAQGACSTDDLNGSNDLPNMNFDVLYFLLKDAGIFKEDDLSDPTEILDYKLNPGTAFIIDALIPQGSGAEINNLDLKQLDSTSWVFALSKAVASSSNCTTPPAASVKYKEVFARNVARSISGLNFEKSGSQLDLNETFDLCETPSVSRTIKIDGHTFSPSVPLTDKVVITKIYKQYNMLGSLAPNKWHLNTSHIDFTQYYRSEVEAGTNELKRTSGEKNKVSDFLTGANAQADAKREIGTSVTKFNEYLLGKLHSHSSVAEAKTNLVLLRGYEQSIMLVLFAFVMLVIASRFLYRLYLDAEIRMVRSEVKKNAKSIEDNYLRKEHEKSRNHDSDYFEKLNLEYKTKSTETLKKFLRRHIGDTVVSGVFYTVLKKLQSNSPYEVDQIRNTVSLEEQRIKNTRWVITWSAITIPAIGFVGTVRGILASLTGADTIVWAQTQAEKASAIGTLSGDLGLSFATTFIALIVGIAISIFNSHQTKNENRLVYELEDVSAQLMDYDFTKERSSKL